MGKDKLRKFKEMEEFEHVVQVPFHVIEHDNFHLKAKWAKDFFKNDNPIVLELGCGKGEYTVELASLNPDVNYIGVDIKGARLWKGAKIAKERGLKNVGFLRTNIELIAQFFGENEVSEIWLTFPDPQMKKARKRLTSTTFLNKYRNFLMPGGIIHLKCDSYFQYNYTRNMARLNEFEILADNDNIYDGGEISEILKIKTYYERQWLERGITIKYLAFKPHSGEYIEPKTIIKFDDYRSFGRSAKD